MRTTVDLPPAVHRRAKDLARRTGRSLSATVAELTARALAETTDDRSYVISELTGLPVYTSGWGPVTDADVANLIDEDE